MTTKKERSPAMQFYFRQFAGDECVMAMDLDAVGAHILLMCAAGASPEGYRIAADERAIRHRIGGISGENWERVKAQLLEGAWKVSSDGKWWVQDGMHRSLLKQKEFSRKQSANAKAGWPDAKNMPPHNSGDAKPMPSTASASSFASASKDSKTTAAADGFCGVHLKITRVEDQRLREAFPDTDVTKAYRQADQWLDSHPEKKRSRFYAFMGNWFRNISKFNPPAEKPKPPDDDDCIVKLVLEPGQ